MKRRVVILGGGPAALSAAYHLTQSPRWQDQLEITVYQQGWRLGGKGASGRALDNGARIEEHGLHVWGGFYENAFAMMRGVYGGIDRPPSCPIRSVEQAFSRQSHVAWGEQVVGETRLWRVQFPENNQRPGDGAPVLTLRQLTRRLMGWFFAIARQLPENERRYWARRLRGDARPAPLRVDHDNLRRATVTLDLIVAVLRGLIVDNVAVAGFSSLDDQDLRGWLSRHGAAPATLDAAPVRAFYDYFFAYEDGDTARPRLAAGMGLNHLLRLILGYKGSLFYTLRAGMGDVVFAPLYELLVQRGVRFAFFHRVDALKADDGGRRVGTITLTRQAETVDGAPYRPLVDVKGLPSWPNAPLFDQLTVDPCEAEPFENPLLPGPTSGTITLREGIDFDAVVLGIPVGELPRVAADLIARRPTWQHMIREMRPIQTLAMQLWWREPPSALGFSGPRTAATALPHPFETWADMSQTLWAEDWVETPPKYVAYYCGPMKTGPLPSDPAAAQAWAHGEQRAARAEAEAWLRANLAATLPNAQQGGQLITSLLHAMTSDEADEGDRLSAQLIRANIAPSERYAVTLPGAPRFQLTPDTSGFTNLALAGDWLNTGLGGSVEGAVVSGMQASRALTGWPATIAGELTHLPSKGPISVDRVTR